MTLYKKVEPALLHAARLASLAGLLFFGFVVAAAAVETKTFDLVVPNGAGPVATRVFRVHENDVVRLRVTSGVPGEAHLHAYRLHAKVASGHPGDLNFTARATGRFRIEWHRAAATGSTSDHHAPPLATLEVWPR